MVHFIAKADISDALKRHAGHLILYRNMFSGCTDLDVVEVDFSQAVVIVVDSLQGFLHIGGVWRLIREDLEWIWFHYT